LAPFQKGEPVKFRRYDCRADRLLTEEELPKDMRILILEGSYCNLPSIRAYTGLRLFVDTPEEIRMERLRKRETPESLRRFRERWIPLENAYFQAYHLPELTDDLLLFGNKLWHYKKYELYLTFIVCYFFGRFKWGVTVYSVMRRIKKPWLVYNDIRQLFT
ncbi:MAG: hypothetical protein J5862_00935, partial [Bacteroidales bacterium]|nr:hypothetical protein [Bacteroidales bacterium]